MRKIVLIVTLLVTASILIIITLLRSSSGYKSEYFIPDDAVVILESKDPLVTWDNIVHSKLWEHYKSNAYFNDLNKSFQTYDSLLNSNKFLFKLIGKKAITVSLHPLQNGGLGQIFIVEIGKIATNKNSDKLMHSILGENFEVTSRSYNENTIIELFDKEDSENYFLYLAKGKLIFSYEPTLIEKAIDASVDKTLGLDMHFLKVKSKVANKGLFSIYFKYENLSSVIKSFSSEYEEAFVDNTKYLSYSAFYIDLNKDGLLVLEGYTSFKDSTPEDYLAMLTMGSNVVKSSAVIPLRIASMLKIHINDANTYFANTMKSINTESYESYNESIAAIEKRFKINVNENLFSWMDDELVMLQTQPSNLGRNNEFALIIPAKDSTKAATNLSFIWKQIKKNSPVKIKSVNYKGYKIEYVAFPEIIQSMFSKTLEQLEKPYISQINDFVIFSNHPQTIKNIINDYQAQNTLKSSSGYYNFSKQLNQKSSAWVYIEPPVLFQNMKAFFDAQTWNTMKENKVYITCFNKGGVQLSKSDEMLHMVFKAQFKPEVESWKRQYYKTDEITSLFSSVVMEEATVKKDTLPHIIISDLDAKKHEEFYNDGRLKLEVKLKDGVKHGSIRAYYPNGNIQYKGEYKEDKPYGKWKYYNKEKELVKTDIYN